MPPSGWRWGGAGPVGKNRGLGDRVLRPPPGTEGRPEAWGPGIPPVAPGRYLRAGEGCGATGCRVQGAFGASCAGTRGKDEAPAGAEGASWAGLAALFGGATWMGRRKGTGSMSPQGTTRPERGALALLGCCPTPCQAPCQVRAGHTGLLRLGGRQHGGHVGWSPAWGAACSRMCPPHWEPQSPTKQGSGHDACVCSQGLGLDFAKGGAPAGSGRGAGQRLTWAAPHRTPGTGHGAQRPLWAVVADGAGSAEGEGSASPGGGAGRPSFTVVPSQAGSLDAGRQSLRTAARRREAPLPPSCCHCLLSLSLGCQGN